MTLTDARALLDAVRNGAVAPAELVKAALQATGDLPTMWESDVVARTHFACAGFVPIARRCAADTILELNYRGEYERARTIFLDTKKRFRSIVGQRVVDGGGNDLAKSGFRA